MHLHNLLSDDEGIVLYSIVAGPTLKAITTNGARAVFLP